MIDPQLIAEHPASKFATDCLSRMNLAPYPGLCNDQASTPVSRGVCNEQGRHESILVGGE
jgi:hypothetical protein